MVPNPPAIRALSQRGGMVYGAADNFGDGYALGTSTDEGTTWQALMTYADVKAINPCLKAHCQTTCEAEVEVSLWTGGRLLGGRAGFDGRGGQRRHAVGQGSGGRAGSGGAGGTRRNAAASRSTAAATSRRRRPARTSALDAAAGDSLWSAARPTRDALRPHPDQVEVAAANRLGLGGRRGQARRRRRARIFRSNRMRRQSASRTMLWIQEIATSRAPLVTSVTRWSVLGG